MKDQVKSRRRQRSCLLVLSLSFLASQALAKDPAASDSTGGKEKNVLITPFIAPGYTPEMGGLLTVGALMSFRTNPWFKIPPDKDPVQRSTLTVNGTYSTTQAATVTAKLTTYLARDRMRVYADLALKDMPDHYWGVGYEAGQAPEGDLTTAYHRTSWTFIPKILWRLREGTFGGVIFDFNSTEATDVSPGVAAEPSFVTYGPKNQNAGAGFVVQYDTRDIAANAWRGIQVNGQAIVYGSFLGSDNNYQLYDLDYRQYKTLGRDGRRLAWKIRSRVGTGNVPWAELPQLGGSSDLRGYRDGRYRDKAMLYGIVEYRYQFTSKKRESGLSRHGLVGWIGAGSVAEKPGVLHDWLPNFGLGYRLEVQPRMSVRVDVGVGKEYLDYGDKFEPSVYFNFTEAF